MATASSPILLHPIPIRRRRRPAPICSRSDHLSQAPLLHTRRLLLSSPAIFLALSSPAIAEDIPLFGLRKKLRNIEEKAEEIIKEGEKAVEEGILAAEKDVEAAAEEGIAAAEGISVVGDFAQACAVVGAEVVGLLVGVSVVNGILGPEGRSS
ncbi:hypothetical protein KSP39_PZI008236 [Platanthera zijinensis]|uniref:Uncharacterized protein n=1 Tax=Platanthera zijinensis TaxID=2320716 RepID=A0AAP0BMX0_9ASPA